MDDNVDNHEKCVVGFSTFSYVFVFLLIFKLLHIFAIPILTKLGCFFVNKSKADEGRMNKLKELTEEKSKLNMTDNFAKYSKLERQIKKVESELQTNSTKRYTNNITVRIVLSMSLKFLQVLISLTIVYVFKNCYLNISIETSLIPVWMKYDFTKYLPIWIVLSMWIALCHYSISVIARYLLSE